MGAFSNNLFYYKGMAAVLAFSGYYLKNEVLIGIGIHFFAHSSFDRFWGYGLKYPDSFKSTHSATFEKGKP